MVDVCNAFAFKNWWTVKSSKSLWAVFMRAKYDRVLKSNLRVGTVLLLLKE